MLRHDFELDDPTLASELPPDDYGVDLPKVFRISAPGRARHAGVRGTEDVMLGAFSFAKYLMWKDLADRPSS